MNPILLFSFLSVPPHDSALSTARPDQGGLYTDAHSSAISDCAFTNAAALGPDVSGTVIHTSLASIILNLQDNNLNVWRLHKRIDINNNVPMYESIMHRTLVAGDDVYG